MLIKAQICSDVDEAPSTFYWTLKNTVHYIDRVEIWNIWTLWEPDQSEFLDFPDSQAVLLNLNFKMK